MKAGLKTTCGIAALLVAAGAAHGQEALFKSQDTVYANEGKIGDRWMLAEGATLATPEYPAAMAARGDDVCIALGYLIKPDGTTSDFAVLKQWNSGQGEREPQEGYWQAFAQSGADALSQWRFSPKPGAPATRPTYTVATLAFTGANGTGGDIRGHCRIDDVAAVVQERKSNAYMRQSRERADLERANRAARARPAMVELPGRQPPKP
jgi:hypothetical protein